MDSRRRFKADIRDDYVQEMFKRKKIRQPKLKTIEGPSQKAKIVTTIPDEMLPKSKETTRLRPEYVKPEHWIQPPKETKMRLDEVLKAEKESIDKKISDQIAWSVAVRNLRLATKPQERSNSNGVDIEEEFAANSGNNNKRPIERKNTSREFLTGFFKRAKQVTDEVNGRKQQSKKSPKIPEAQLAFGVGPDANEIVL